MTQKSLDDRHSEVPGNYYENSIKTNLFQHFWHLRRFEEVGANFSALSPKTVLDIGCHGGTFTSYLTSLLPGARFTAIDMSRRAINYAKKKYPTIAFQVARAEKLPFQSAQFDMVTCLEVLEHTQYPDRVLEEIHRVLKKRGNALLLVPTENRIFSLIWFFWTRFGSGRVWHHTHVQKFYGRTLDRLLKKHGFAVAERKTFLLGMLLLIYAKKLNSKP